MRIAITGGIAEGKSTVLRYCREAGYKTGSSDEIARQVFQQEDVQRELAKLLSTEPPVDRAKLRQAIAQDQDIRRQVNSITHPRIVRAKQDSEVQIWEIPLLIETALYGQFERVWVVTCGPEEQLRRLTERLGDEQAARNLIATQMTSRAKCSFADVIVRTNSEETLVQQYVLSVLNREPCR